MFTEKLKSFMPEENPIGAVGNLAQESAERLGPWGGNTHWSCNNEPQCSLFPLLFSSRCDDWVQNSFE